MSAPVFIVGANRSGTTLLRLILNAHSRIAIPEELVYFDTSLLGVSPDQWKSPSLSSSQYEQFVTHFLEKNCAPLGLDARALRQRILRKPPDFRRPYQEVLEAWAQSNGKARWGEKTPGNLFYSGTIHDMFPKAQFVYLARDPRAGVHSMNNTDFLSNDTTINALNRRHYAKNGLAVLRESVPSEQRISIRYEDLVTKPEQTTQAVCTFLGEEYEPAMLHFHEKAEQYMRRRAANSFNQAATGPIDPSKVNGWKERLPAEEVAIVEFLCHAEMKRFRYALQGDTMNTKSRVGVYVKWLYYEMRRWRNPDKPQFILTERMFERSRYRMKRIRRSMSTLI